MFPNALAARQRGASQNEINIRTSPKHQNTSNFRNDINDRINFETKKHINDKHASRRMGMVFRNKPRSPCCHTHNNRYVHMESMRETRQMCLPYCCMMLERASEAKDGCVFGREGCNHTCRDGAPRCNVCAAAQHQSTIYVRRAHTI